MTVANASDHPLCRANTLYYPTPNAPPGAYSHILDLIMTKSDPPTDFYVRFEGEDDRHPLSMLADVARFEYCNRMFTHLEGTSFDIVRQLTGISHALLSAIADFAWENRVGIRGRSLAELRPSGGPSAARLFIAELLRRVQSVENLIDQIWHAVGPVAEFGSIDFSDRVRLFVFLSWERELQRKRTALKVINMIERYPPDFGGYHEGTDFESFQALMIHIWKAYRGIDDLETRKELLRLSLAAATFDGDRLVVRNPIATLAENISVARQDSVAARIAFGQECQRIHAEASRGVRAIEKEMLRDLDPKVTVARFFAPALATHVAHQIDWDFWMDGGILPWDQRHLRYFQDDYEPFLWHWIEKDGREHVRINNEVFIDRVPRDQKGDLLIPVLPVGWWRRLIVLEAFRQSVKSGSPLVCPFRRCTVRSNPSSWSEDFPQDTPDCHKHCPIGRWLERAGQWSDLPMTAATCKRYISERAAR